MEVRDSSMVNLKQQSHGVVDKLKVSPTLSGSVKKCIGWQKKFSWINLRLALPFLSPATNFTGIKQFK